MHFRHRYLMYEFVGLYIQCQNQCTCEIKFGRETPRQATSYRMSIKVRDVLAKQRLFIPVVMLCSATSNLHVFQLVRLARAVATGKVSTFTDTVNWLLQLTWIFIAPKCYNEIIIRWNFKSNGILNYLMNANLSLFNLMLKATFSGLRFLTFASRVNQSSIQYYQSLKSIHYY